MYLVWVCLKFWCPQILWPVSEATHLKMLKWKFGWLHCLFGILWKFTCGELYLENLAPNVQKKSQENLAKSFHVNDLCAVQDHISVFSVYKGTMRPSRCIWIFHTLLRIWELDFLSMKDDERCVFTLNPHGILYQKMCAPKGHLSIKMGCWHVFRRGSIPTWPNISNDPERIFHIDKYRPRSASRKDANLEDVEYKRVCI